MDELWDIISNNIMRSANLTLPSQRVEVGTKILKKKDSSDKVRKDLRQLGRICHLCAVSLEQSIAKEMQQQINIVIDMLNSKHELQIERLTEEYWSQEREKELKKAIEAAKYEDTTGEKKREFD